MIYTAHKACIATCITLMLSFTVSLGQSKQATIEVTRFETSRTGLSISCNVSISEGYRPSNDENPFMLYFIRYDQQLNLRLGRLLESDNNPPPNQGRHESRFVRIRERNQTIGVDLAIESGGNPMAIYAVVLVGNPDYIERSFPLVDGEFHDIQDILNVLYKSRLKPLGYVEHRVVSGGR